MRSFSNPVKFLAFSLLILTAFSIHSSGQDTGLALQIAKTVTSSTESAATAEKSIDAVKPQMESATPLSVPAKVNGMSRTGIQTASTLPLSLDDAIRRALQNNNDIEIARSDIKLQETQLRALRGFYDPTLNFTPTFSRNSSTGNRATNDFRANANITQNLGTGGFYQFFFNNTRTENSFTQAQLTSGSSGITSAAAAGFYSTSTGFQLTQPLLRNFGIDNNRRLIRIQKKRLQQSDADFRQQTIEIIAQVQRAYWDLVFALRDQQNRLANLNLAKENLRQIEAKIDAGAAAPLARAEVNTEVATREGELLSATQSVSAAENTLKTLLLRDPAAAEWSFSLVPTDRPVYSDEPVDLEDALADARTNRPELRRLSLEKEINEIDLDYFKNQTKPQIDLNASFSLNGISRGLTGENTETVVPQFTGNEEILRQRLNTLLPPGSQIPNPNIVIPPTPDYLVGGFGQSISNVFRSDAPNYSVGVTFSFPLRNRTAEANLAGARITEERISAQTRSREQTVIAEVRNAVQAVETARLRVLTARRARENAEIQLEGERKLFEVGRSTTFLLFQRENALVNARNAEIRAETDYNKFLAELQKATSTTFRANNIEVESMTDDN